MKDTEINIAIAEWCGWKFGEEHIESPTGEITDCEFLTEIGVEQIYPDYCHDLNAMHEAEGKLPRELHKLFLDWLCDLCPPRARPGYNHWAMTHSTARQRAEALLRTLAKWKE